MYVIMFVLDKAKLLDKLLLAWQEIGINGATIMDSTGIQRQLKRRAGPHLHFLFTPVSVGAEHGNLTLFIIVESKEMVEKCLQTTESITGDLDQPNTGIFTVWPATMVKGIRKEPN